MHGDLTVCASMDLREHPPVRPLTVDFLNEATTEFQTVDGKMKNVILAPFGLSATLTGQTFKAADSASQKLLDDWFSFYPLRNNENSDLPPLVEVITGICFIEFTNKIKFDL